MAFKLRGRNAVLQRPATAAAALDSLNGWPRNRSAPGADDGYELTADDVAELYAQLRNLIDDLGGTRATETGHELAAAVLGRIPNVNLLINGDFQINQRGYAGAGVVAGAYSVDRWKGGAAGGAAFTISGDVVTLVAGALEQIIEPAEMAGVASLAAIPLTVSVDTPTAAMTVTLGSVSGTIPAGTGRRSVTLTPAAGDVGPLMLRLGLVSAAASFGRVKIEIGQVMTPWQPRAASTEFLLAQRYFAKSYAPSVAPGTITDAAMIEHRDTRAGQGGKEMLNTRFAVPMRVTPTVVWYSNVTGAAANIRAVHTGAGDQPVATTTGTSTVSTGYPSGLAVVNAVGDLWRAHFTASAEI